MAKFLEVTIFLTLIILNEAATPLFLQAITSALATIPFTGGPISTGLVGAKLGIGTKLLYYLGYFGRQPKNKLVPKTPEKFQSSWRDSSLQPLPLYILSSEGYPVSRYQSFRFPSSRIDPVQLLQALTVQGINPNIAMNALSYASGMESNTKLAPFGINPEFGVNSKFNAGINPALASNSNPGFSSANKAFISNVQQTSHETAEDLESFFTFLQDMDENTCISRLICDIGNDPSFLGEFSRNIHSMVGSLSVRPSTLVSSYLEIMQNGGKCEEKFPQCSEAAYEVVKSLAPSVDLPTRNKI